MAQPVVRAAQNTYDLSQAGGTRALEEAGRDVTQFIDALSDVQYNTPFLNSLSKQSAGDQMVEKHGVHRLLPQGSRVAGAVLATDTSIPIIAGHGFRFQQMAVLAITNASGETEVLWVNADPTGGALPVKRAQGGTTALTFAAGDKIKVIGHATPENADWPLMPVTSGTSFWNTYQTFSGHYEMSDFDDISPELEWSGGSKMSRQMLEAGKLKRKELNDALLHGRRQLGDPDPSGTLPRTLGGMVGYAELSGNRFTVAGGAPLSLDFLVEAQYTLSEKYGDNSFARRGLMSPRTGMVVNRIASPVNYDQGMENGKLKIGWKSFETPEGEFVFSTQPGLPDGKIFIYEDSNHGYAPFKNKDWKEKETPTKGDHRWKGLSGTFTYRPKHPEAYAIFDGFSMNVADYPAMIRTA